MKKRLFGRLDGRPVEEIVLESADAAVAVLSYGSTVRDWRVDGPDGSLPMVLGFPRLEDYVEHARSHGALCGRVANRTAGASFELDGRTYHLTANNGPNHLHGGTVGLQRRIWEMEADTAADAVHLRYLSPDGEEGYPGAVEFTVTWRLEGPRLITEMRARPDRPTPISLAQHSYYNLGGGGTVRDHVVWIDADAYTPAGPDLIPDGRILPVEGTKYDFTVPRAFEDADPDGGGYDNNLVLRGDRDTGAASARVQCPRTGLQLELRTAEPGAQLFDASKMTIGTPGHDGARYGPFAGFCLEAQHFPDSLHQPDWPSIIRSPENPYFQRLEVEIAPG